MLSIRTAILGAISSLALMVLSAGPGRASLITWVGSAGDQSWHTAANWDLNRVPGSSDQVNIPDLLGTSSVSFTTGSTTIFSMGCDENFGLGGGTLTINAPSYSAKSLTINSGTLAGSGDLEVYGAFAFYGGTMTGSGTTRIGSGVVWTLFDATLSRPLENFGICYQQGGPLTINSPGVFRNNGGINEGILFINANILGTGSIVNGSGAYMATRSGNVTVGCSVTNNGSISVNSGHTLTLGSLTNLSGGTLTGGSYSCEFGVLTLPGDIITNTADIWLADALLKVGGGKALENLQSNTGTIGLAGVRTFSSMVTNSGLLYTYGAATFNGGYTQTTGETRFLGGTLISSIPVQIQGGLVQGDGKIQGSVINNGVFSPGYSSRDLLEIQGNYTQASGGSLDLEVFGGNETEFDRLKVTGIVSLDGHVSVALNGFNPGPQFETPFLTGGSIVGAFSSEDLPDMTPNCAILHYYPQNVSFKVAVPPPCPPTNAPGFELAWGTQGSGPGEFNKCDDVTSDANGTVYVTDRSNSRIQMFDRNGNYLGQWGSFGSGNGQFNSPTAVGVDNMGHVFVGDQGNHRIQRFSADGVFQLAWGSFGTGNGQFNTPAGVAIDGAGDVYIADASNHRIQVFTNDGVFIRKWGSLGAGSGQFHSPEDVDIGPNGLLYVADTYNHRIQIFNTNSAPVTSFGSFGTGPGQFNLPTGLTLDEKGNIYVSDYFNYRIQKFSSALYQTEWGTQGSGNGQFQGAYSIDSGRDGVIYVADTGNHRIQKFACTPVNWTSEWYAAANGFPNQVCTWVGFDGATPENPVLSGGILTLSTSDFIENMYYEQSSSLVIPNRFLISARLRLVSESHQAGNPRRGVSIGFTVAADNANFLNVGRDTLSLWSAFGTQGPTAYVDTDDAFHTYVIEVLNLQTVNVYQDDVIILTGSITTSPNYGDAPDIYWGDGTGNASAVSEWQFVRHNANTIPCGNVSGAPEIEKPGRQPGMSMIPDQNPARGPLILTVRSPRDVDAASLTIFDVTGRIIRTMEPQPLREGITTLRWDGRDNRGRATVDGIYLLRLEAGDRILARSRVVRLR